MTDKEFRNKKYKKLALSLVFDAVGMLSFTIPFLGESFDFIWAPISAFLMTRMYKGSTGKIAGLASLFEELMPMTDIIPTFTLTWIYEYVLKGRKVTGEIIDIN